MTFVISVGIFDLESKRIYKGVENPIKYFSDSKK